MENCLKKERKRRSENKREHQQANAEENQTEREGKDETEARNEDDTTEVERMECSRENIPEYKDDGYKELTRRAQNIIERRAKTIKRKKPKKAKPRRMKNEVDRDEEYESLANKVWMKNLEVEKRALDKAQPRRGKTIRDYDEDYTQLLRGMCNRKNDCGRESADGNREDNSRGESEEDRDGSEDSIEENEDLAQQDVVVISDSDDCKADPDYIYDGNAGSDVFSQSDMSRESSSLLEEGEGLMMELVEVVGEGNVDEGSFLDREPDWRDAVKDFKDGRLSEVHVFTTRQESSETLMRLYEASGDIEYVFRDVLDGDQSDDDAVLDTEWVPSDCNMEEREDAKTGSQAGNNDEVNGELLGGFYKWLIDVDGGYRSDKMAQQYKSQVERVIKRLKMKETGTNDVQENKKSVYLLLQPGKDGVNLLKTWLSYAVEKYQPGTVRSYLMSLRLFYKFLMQERKADMADESVDTINARRDLMTSWSAAQKKKVLKRKLQKYDEDFKKLLSSEQLYKVCHGGQRIKTVKELGATSVETNRGAEVRRVVKDQTHCEVRDWLITRLLIDNSGRCGVAANLTVSEFEEAVFYPGKEEDLARWRMLVEEHKTAENYGAAVVWVYDDLYKLMNMCVRTVRSQFIESDPEVKQLFVSSNGVPLTASQVSTSLWRTFQREGIVTEGRISATILRKSFATGMHVYMPNEKEHLAALEQHKTQTQANYYRVQDKVRETHLGRRAVSKFVSLKQRETSHPRINI